MTQRPDWIQSISQVAATIDRDGRVPYRVAFVHGTLEAGVYTPGERDPQQPHTRDEAYIVMAGSGTFVNGRERVSFSTGDFIFVAAGVEHRFEEYTPDLALWVLFYGPEGGE